MDFIYNQAKTKHIKYGLLTSDINGCGWIAAYNTLQYLGVDITPEQTAYELERQALWFFGLFGTKISRLAKYLKSYNITTAVSSQRETFEERIKNSKAGILFYFPKMLSAHYVMCIPIEDNKIQIYNIGNLDTVVVSNINVFLKKRKIKISYLITIN